MADGARAEADGDKSDGPLGDESARVRAQAGEVRGGGAQAGAVGRDREEREVVEKQIRAGAGQQRRGGTAQSLSHDQKRSTHGRSSAGGGVKVRRMGADMAGVSQACVRG